MTRLMRAVAVGAAVSLAGAVLPALPVRGAGAEIVLSEVMYHAADGTTDDDDDYDFIELMNIGDESVDLIGWEVAEGFDYLFTASTVVGPGAFVVLAHDAVAFEERYGFAPDGQFDDGKLKNSSELVLLRDAAGVDIDSVAYNDDAPWPGAADGDGPSLEKLDLARVNEVNDSDAVNWLASEVEFGTPGAANSVLSAGPRIEFVDDGDARPDAGKSIPVSASILNVDAAEITYRVAFGRERTLPMFDDAASAGGAGDGVYTALLPGQKARTLVRYVVTATNANDDSQSPRTTDTINYHGLVTADPDEPTDIATIDQFMTGGTASKLLGSYRYRNVYLPTVIAFGDTVVDNAGIRVRGGLSRQNAKPSFKVELPTGHLIDFGDELDEPVDEFNMFLSADPATGLGWEMLAELDLQDIDVFPWRVYQNGKYFGTGSYLTATDGRYRDAAGYGDAAVYKADGQMEALPTAADIEYQWEKKEGADDFTDMWEFTNLVDAAPSQEQFDGLLEAIDVPAVINYWAWVTLVLQSDAAYHNHFVIRDPEDSGRWHVDAWDLSIFGKASNRPLWFTNMTLIETMNEYPEFREMHERRVRSMVDQFSPEELIARYDAEFAVVREAMEDDYAEWRQLGRPSRVQQNWSDGVEQRWSLFNANEPGPSGELLPPTQSADRPIGISAVTGAIGGVPDLVEFVNNSTSESFDLSGWTIDEIGLTAATGTVLLPGATVTFSSDDVTFRAATEGRLAGGEFNELPAFGDLTLRDRDGALVDMFSIAPPVDTDGDGVINSDDNCVVDPNADQADVDSDGIGDVCDSDSTDGPTGDVDGDGVINSDDNCVVDPNADQADVDSDGTGDACDSDSTDGPTGDVDGDGVINSDDNCVVDPNADQADVDADGIGDVCDPLDENVIVVVGASSTEPTVRVTVTDDVLFIEWDEVENASDYQFRYRLYRGSWIKDNPTDDLARELERSISVAPYTVQVRAKVDRWKPWTTVVIPAA